MIGEYESRVRMGTADRPVRRLGVSPFGELPYFGPPIVDLGGGGSIIFEFGWIPSTPITPGHSGVVGYYEMFGDPKGRNPFNVVGGYGGEFHGGGPAAERLLAGTPEKDDCEPMAWGMPTDTWERANIAEMLGAYEGSVELPIERDFRAFICDIVKVLLDPSESCLPPELKRCMARAWKNTRIWLQSEPCYVQTDAGVAKYGAFRRESFRNRDEHYIVLCETALVWGSGEWHQLWEVLLHELLHTCGTSELESFVFTALCFHPANARASRIGIADPENGIPWNIVSKYWDSDVEVGRIGFNAADGKWYGQYIRWDCQSGIIEMLVDGRWVQIFPNGRFDTGSARPSAHAFGFFDRCPE